MLKTFLITSLLLAMLFGAGGVSAAAIGNISPGEMTRQLNLQREQIQSSMNYGFHNQVQEQLNPGPAANSTATAAADCDGTPDRDQDRLQDHDQDQLQDHAVDQLRDRVHQVEPDGTAHEYQNRSGSQP